MEQLDVVDRRLLHALQIEPRATWTELAPIVGVDAATLGRRWDRLRSEGVAWVTGHPTRGMVALVEIECVPASLEAAAAELSGDARLYVLDDTSGARDLLATIRGDDLGSLAEHIATTMARIPGVRAARTHIVTDVLIDGARWRLRELTDEESERVPRPRPPRSRAPRVVAPEVRRALEQELWVDGRLPVATVAQRHDLSPQRVADGLAAMRRGGELAFRTDIAREVSGWPIYAWYFVEAPAKTIEAARQAIAAVPEVRLAVTSSSRYNLILAVWLRRLADVNRFEIALEAALPGARIADRAVVPRIRKHMNQRIGLDTRSHGQSDAGPFPAPS
ncbi:Lrp/AsnC family transcriptional regulator [Microbacterium oleivorans]|uniref:AsnC family transcriptional regulator n=1 Tax=Microbacterium oleivorans TaxID=273677 RepID=A0A7D5EZ97_9MICO|nr:AsnC family transcriptional regulator [Microbacterium oleivorans]QLD12248.1 AsnC family transcriptional regulator [Microbacterium oleivorans]